jgi:capsular polysaccharide transport system permease protein
MHGIIKPLPNHETEPKDFRVGVIAWWKRNLTLLLFVVAPTLLTAAYYYLVAADQYRSEAHFVVRTGDASPGPSNGLGQFLGVSAGVSQARSDALSVNDYLESRNAVDRLDRDLDLKAIFSRPEADFVSKLRPANPTAETLVKYYRDKVKVHLDSESGITTIEAVTYRPQDSFNLISSMLSLGEQRVNFLNQRSLKDTLANAQRHFDDAENSLAAIQVKMTRFRQQRGDIDPAGSGKAQIGLVSTLEIGLSEAKSYLASMRGIIAPSSPQYIAAVARVRALEAQVAAQSSKLVSGDSGIASKLGSYEDLQVRQEFAVKRYEAAAANLERARDQANKQQLYIVRVVDPQLAVKSLRPERGKAVATVFFILLVTYAIGWLIMAGVKEHSL